MINQLLRPYKKVKNKNGEIFTYVRNIGFDDANELLVFVVDKNNRHIEMKAKDLFQVVPKEMRVYK